MRPVLKTFPALLFSACLAASRALPAHPGMVDGQGGHRNLQGHYHTHSRAELILGNLLLGALLILAIGLAVRLWNERRP